MSHHILKLATIRKNEVDPCPFCLEIPYACQAAGDLVDRMAPVQHADPEAGTIANSNRHLFLWKNPNTRCRYAGKILDPQTQAVECNWGENDAGETSIPLVGSPWYTKHFSGVGLDGAYTFPLGYYADNSIDRGMYYGMYSIESIASVFEEDDDSIIK